jgi:RNA polymerase sigma-70 factor (ECF subfamily)
MLSDQDLVQRILERDAHAFEAIFECYAETIRRHLARLVENDASAQDLVQETFLRVWTRAEQWDGRGSFAGWLYRIATNLAFNYLRSVGRRRELPLEPEDDDAGVEEGNLVPAWMMDPSPGPDAAFESIERSERFRHLVQGLPEDKRDVLYLVHEMEMSIHAAADELGIPEGTAKSRLHYAKKRLAREWQDLETKWEER